MFKRIQLVMQEIALYHEENWLVNYLALLAGGMIIIFQVTEHMPVLFELNVNIVNYYFNVLVNLSIGYLASTIFYILVVYYPNRKKQKVVKVKTSILFARLQTQLRTITSVFVNAVGYNVDAREGVPAHYIDYINNIEIFDLMKQYIVPHPDGTTDGLSEVIRASSEIELLKARLVPYLAYMEQRELDLYANLEEIFIFENMDKLDRFPPKQYLLIKEFPDVVKVFYDCQLIVKGVKNEFVLYDKNIY